MSVEYGQGTGQAIYLLEERGANLVAEQLGIDRAKVRWRTPHNRVGSPFLEHTLMVNYVRTAFKLAAEQQRYEIARWVTEDELRQSRTTSGSRRKVGLGIRWR